MGRSETDRLAVRRLRCWPRRAAPKYAIVIAKNAHYGENMAAEELGHFLWGVTGAEFTIRRDSEPASEFEIMVGNTNRKKMEEIPGDLRTDNWEGFTLFREDAKLYIMGNIPRATLFGVYDFLDVELGVRFLTAEVTHVPAKPMLKVQMKSRTFSPRFERRTIWSDLGGASKLRNRMNGAEFYLIDSKLGGIKWVGPAKVLSLDCRTSKRLMGPLEDPLKQKECF